MRPTYEQLRALRQRLSLPWFTDPWDLNLVILRSDEVGRWDDLLCLAYVDGDGREHVEVIPCTSDAWVGEWTSPTHPDGCLYILDQHVPGGYGPGLHKGRPALRQREPFRYVRWPRRDRIPTVDELEALAASASFTGIRGTHVHNRVSDRVPERPARDDSEGCVVVMRAGDIHVVMRLVELQRRHVGTDTVSPTFARLRDLR